MTRVLTDDDGPSWLGVETREVSADKVKELKLPAERGVAGRPHRAGQPGREGRPARKTTSSPKLTDSAWKVPRNSAA